MLPFLLLILCDFNLRRENRVLCQSVDCENFCMANLTDTSSSFSTSTLSTTNSQGCYRGCQNLHSGLESGCDVVCNFSTVLKIEKSALNCLNGCQIAALNFMQEKVKIFEAPQLLPKTLTSTSLTLEWKPPEIENYDSNLLLANFYLQQKFPKKSGAKWVTVRKIKSDLPVIKVDNLEPYEEYQFRVVWKFSNNFEGLKSEPSLPIFTPPGGLSSSPRIVSIDQVGIFSKNHLYQIRYRMTLISLESMLYLFKSN